MKVERRVGKPAVPYALADANGERVTSEDDQGRWQLLVFHRHLG